MPLQMPGEILSNYFSAIKKGRDIVRLSALASAARGWR
jgi:hypothetical protein